MTSYTYDEGEPPQPPLDHHPPLSNFKSVSLSDTDQQTETPIKLEEPLLSSQSEKESLTPEEQLQQVCKLLRNTQGKQFFANLPMLGECFRKGYSKYFTTTTDLMRKMMNHFTKYSKDIHSNNFESSSQCQYKMLYILSLIAQLIRQNPKFFFPFTKRFLITVFSMDQELLLVSSKKDQILAILGNILQNISKQGRLLRKFKILNDVKMAILNNYHLITEIYTVKLFNNSIQNLVRRDVNFTTKQLQEFGVLKTISSFIWSRQVEIFKIQMQMLVTCQETTKVALQLGGFDHNFDPTFNNCQKIQYDPSFGNQAETSRSTKQLQ